MEQKRPLHLQVNPVSPTFFLHTPHRFFFFFPSLGPSSPAAPEAALAPALTSELSWVSASACGLTQGTTVGWAVSSAVGVAEAASSLLLRLWRLELEVEPAKKIS